MSFVAGLLRGFNQRSAQAREESRAEQERQDALEEKALTMLAGADAPGAEEIAARAQSALFERATGTKAPKGGFLANLLGPKVQVNPALQQLMSLVNSPAPEQAQGSAPAPAPRPASTPPPAQGAMGAPISLPPPPAGAPRATAGGPPPPVGTTPFGPPEGGPLPPQAAPGSAAMAPPPSPGSLSPQAAAPPPTGGSTEPPAGPSLGATKGLQRFGITPPPPRKLFLSTTEKALAGAKAKAQGDVEGEIAGMIAAGIPAEKARAAILAKYERMAKAGARDSFAEGEKIRKPDGSWVQILYNRYDPTDTIEMPATAPSLLSVATPNEDAQLASELFSDRFPGRTGAEILRDPALTPAMRTYMDKVRRSRLGQDAFASGTGAGLARIETEKDMPWGPDAAAQQGVSALTTNRMAGDQPLGRPLSEIAVRQITETRNAVSMVTTMAEALDAIDPTSGQIVPGPGSTGALNKLRTYIPGILTERLGWGADDKSKQAVIDLGKQIIGKALEGGVLRKEDEIKYVRILPTIQDPPEVAASKMRTLHQKLTDDLEMYLHGMRSAGFRVDGPVKVGGAPPPVSGGTPEVEWVIVNGQLVRKGG